jgi:hypothetical protein
MSTGKMVTLLALTSSANLSLVYENLLALDVELIWAESADRVARQRRLGRTFEVVLIPETLPDEEWWSLWEELNAFNILPSILVYSRRPTLRLWSAVLDLKGRDVISETFTGREIESAILKAARDYRKRAPRILPAS